jgi:hypothetical protein
LWGLTEADRLGYPDLALFGTPLTEGMNFYSPIVDKPVKVLGKFGAVYILSCLKPSADGIWEKVDLRLPKKLVVDMIPSLPWKDKTFEVEVRGKGLTVRTRILNVSLARPRSALERGAPPGTPPPG